MSLSSRQRSYKALTHINLPFIEKRYAPGDEIKTSDLQKAQQTDDDVKRLVDDGALGEENDEIHPQNIIPDPGVPTIQLVVANAQRVAEELEARGEKVPNEVRALAKLDIRAVTSGDQGASDDRNR